MPRATSAIPVYTEAGSKRVFAGAVEWPGWCRSGRDEAGALGALAACAPRYAKVVAGKRLGFPSEKSPPKLRIVERIEGNATTDFGAPANWPASDLRPIAPRELRRLRTVLEASWAAFDGAVRSAAGIELRRGPRGGGRELDRIVGHVVAAEAAYVRHLASRPPIVEEGNEREALTSVREAVVDALTRGVTEGLPEKGPRGGVIWPPRHFVNRTAWHALDHAWEIEDRSRPGG